MAHRSGHQPTDGGPAAGTVGGSPSVPVRGRGRRLHALHFLLAFLKANPFFAVGYAIVFVVVLLAVLAPVLTPYPPMTANPDDYLQPPNMRHWLGTDSTGMDVLSRIIYAPRIDLTI